MAARPQEQAGMTPAERSRLEALVERWSGRTGRGWMILERIGAPPQAEEIG